MILLHIYIYIYIMDTSKKKSSTFTINLNENDNSLSSINDSNLSENQSLNYILKRNEALDSENSFLKQYRELKLNYQKKI